jgi:stearoyl-CoA desaturase (delta-9 desaturase)
MNSQAIHPELNIESDETNTALLEPELQPQSEFAESLESNNSEIGLEVVEETPPQRIPFKERFAHGVCWWNVGWMALVHVGAVAALWHFSWPALLVCVVLHFLTLCIGITLGYHRLLSHNSMKVSRPVKYFISLMGVLSAQGSPLYWVSSHRKHHAFSDEPEDPHSPLDGFWWSHMLWIKPRVPADELKASWQRWAPDLYKDPVQRFFAWSFPLFTLALAAVMYFVGEWTMGLGTSMLLWGICFRLMVVYHFTWFVNSATHVWGYRNYATPDQSRNLWWVALLTFGEGWHNNHHAYQRLAVHGHKWWEVDITWMVIRAMRKLGLASDVQDKFPADAKD